MSSPLLASAKLDLKSSLIEVDLVDYSTASPGPGWIYRYFRYRVSDNYELVREAEQELIGAVVAHDGVLGPQNFDAYSRAWPRKTQSVRALSGSTWVTWSTATPNPPLFRLLAARDPRIAESGGFAMFGVVSAGTAVAAPATLASQLEPRLVGGANGTATSGASQGPSGGLTSTPVGPHGRSQSWRLAEERARGSADQQPAVLIPPDGAHPRDAWPL